MSEIYVQVKVEEGILRGRKKTSEGISSTVRYNAFQGIPFAKPPVGDLRFKAPEPAEFWDGIRDAFEDGAACPQKMFTPSPIGSEDCLYLNVFTPELPAENQDLKPVLFNIHGGGFCGGDGGTISYNPDYYMEHGLVFVSPNYRVGALGFLSLQNDEISGNAGLKDQILALKWTQKNIKQFGGDPENITLIGLSAGGASVEYLLLSELGKGLFKRAIMRSGSSLNSWTLNPDPRKFAVKLAELLGYSGNTQDDKSLEKFLLQCSAEDIVQNQEAVLNDKEKLQLLNFTFEPCVEKEGNGQKFITTKPREIFESGRFSKVPIIIGLTNSEGCIYFMSRTLDKDFENINNDWELLIPMNLNVPENKKTEVAREIMQFYFDCKPITRQNTDSFTQLIGDVTFNNGISDATKYFAQRPQTETYCYGVSYETSVAVAKKFTKTLHPDIELKGVPHGGDYELTFKMVNNPLMPEVQTLSPTDTKYLKVITTMIASFAKTGNPNYEGMDFPAWEPATAFENKYLDIGDELKMIPESVHEERLQFWHKLYSKYGYLY